MAEHGAHDTSLGSGPIPPSLLDSILVTQIAVAWAGEDGEEPRLRWWRSDLVSEYGGKDLFRRLLSQTWRWATLQAVREAARRTDARMRQGADDPDSIVSLYCLGFAADEKVEERLLELKKQTDDPMKALPRLAEIVGERWRRDTFLEWVRSHGTAEVLTTPLGRRIKGTFPGISDLLIGNLVGALEPLGEQYPLPHYRRTR